MDMAEIHLFYRFLSELFPVCASYLSHMKQHDDEESAEEAWTLASIAY